MKNEYSVNPITLLIYAKNKESFLLILPLLASYTLQKYTQKTKGKANLNFKSHGGNLA